MPPSALKTPAPSFPRSPPLVNSLHHNVDTPSLHAVLTPPGSVKLKVRSGVSSEARSRVLLKPRGLGIKLAPVPSHSDALDWLASDCTGLADPAEIREPTRQLAASEAVLVTVRIRPPNEVEKRTDANSVWVTPAYDDHLIKLAQGRDGAKDDREWIFDRILPPVADNAQAYDTSARSHVQSAMDGFNAVIFAYGQTASGKTFTLTGSPSDPGIIPLAISDLFGQIRSTPDREFLLRASYLELYNETIIDLLSPEGRELSLSEGKKKGEVVINGLTECAVRTEGEVRRLLASGEERRKVGGTDWNQRSSRSHCVFRIVIESRSRSIVDGTRTPGKGDKTTRISTLSIIDLAGSERHTSSKERNAEGKHINQSLLTLKLVISKLADMASKRNVTHVPYRDSKLTRLLQPSLSGDALISVICTVSPSALNVAESISTLAFAQGLKRVMLRAQRKEVVDPEALIQQYQSEIAELRALLREKEEGQGSLGSVRSDKKKSSAMAMELRLNELKSLILTSGSMETPVMSSSALVRPLSPTKLKYPKLELDKTSSLLREELHAAELKVSEQAAEIERLERELGTRPLDPDARCLELQDECAQLRMIASDYERHLREPSRKVREDVEREWAGRVTKLEAALESKTIWANRLDENVRMLAMDKRDMEIRCEEAEQKVRAIFEWVTAVLDPDSSSDASSAPPTLVVTPNPEFASSGPSLPDLVALAPAAADDDDELADFAPPLRTGAGADGLPAGTLKLTASRMTRSQLSAIDLGAFTRKFGTLGTGTSNGTRTGRSGLGLGAMSRDDSYAERLVADDF
ncbi:Kinesin-like protein kip2 [Cryptotrichosporon argae]